VIPLFCVVFAVLLVCVAVAVDFGRLNLVATEVQIAADAGAHAATLAVQRAADSPAPDWQGAATASAVALGTANRAANAPALVAAADVAPKRFDPTGDVVLDTTWATANAVQVTARARMTYAFAGGLGLAPPVVTRRATGAFTVLVGMSCVRPFLVPYAMVYNRAAGTGYAMNQGAPDMTAAQMRTLGGLTPSQRSFTLLGPSVAPPASPARYSDANWQPVDFTGGAGTLASYGDWARGVNCGTATAVVRQPRGSVHKAGTSSQFVDALSQAMASVCVRALPSAAATCYASAGALHPGVAVRVAVGDVAGAAPGAPVRVRVVTTMLVMCYYATWYDKCQWDNNWPEAPGWWETPGGDQNNYPPGTITLMAPTPFPGVLPYTSDMVFGGYNPMAPKVVGGGPSNAGGMFLAR
jgi:Flp pilus assembly protein TadG